MKHTIKVPIEVIEFFKIMGNACKEADGSTFYYSPFFIEQAEDGEHNLLRFYELPKGIQAMVEEKNDWKIKE